MSKKDEYIINKYHDIIAEELNIKKVVSLSDDVVVKKVYKPL
jgi:hypothetical protein